MAPLDSLPALGFYAPCMAQREMMMDDRRRLQHAAAEAHLQRLAADVLVLRAMGEHARAEALTRRRDALARDTYRRAIDG